MGLLAAETKRLELATAVTDPYIRHPALTADAIATVADASGGRAILGLGAGASGFGALSIERPAPATALRETIELSRLLWTSAEAFSYEGRQVSFRDSRARVPARRHRSRSGSPAAARRSSSWRASSPTACWSRRSSTGRCWTTRSNGSPPGEARRRPGLAPLERGSWAYVSIDPDRAAAREAVRTGIAVAMWGSRPIVKQLGIELPAELTRLMDETAYSAEPEVIGRAAALIPEWLIDQCSIAGTRGGGASRRSGAWRSVASATSRRGCSRRPAARSTRWSTSLVASVIPAVTRTV